MTPDIHRRIEAAARASDTGHPGHDYAMALATRMLKAAFPELFSDPPSAWLAPVEPTETMLEVYGSATAKATAGGCYALMRNAHLNLPPKDEEQDG